MMVESFTQQVNCFTDSRKECQAVQALATPTPFESELVHAIQNGQVYPVFQPIVDIHLHIKGIEVLSRVGERTASFCYQPSFCRTYSQKPFGSRLQLSFCKKRCRVSIAIRANFILPSIYRPASRTITILSV